MSPVAIRSRSSYTRTPSAASEPELGQFHQSTRPLRHAKGSGRPPSVFRSLCSAPDRQTQISVCDGRPHAPRQTARPSASEPSWLQATLSAPQPPGTTSTVPDDDQTETPPDVVT